MTKPRNFEPYLDPAKVNRQMLIDIKNAGVRQRKAVNSLINSKSLPTPDELIDILESLQEFNDISARIYSSIYTEPTMIHVAGEISHEEHNDISTVVQRCSRCGSVLQMWNESMGVFDESGPHRLDEDDVEWWKPGQKVGKSQGGGPYIGVYEVDNDRELLPQEFMCVEMPRLEE